MVQVVINLRVGQPHGIRGIQGWSYHPTTIVDPNASTETIEELKWLCEKVRTSTRKGYHNSEFFVIVDGQRPIPSSMIDENHPYYPLFDMIESGRPNSVRLEEDITDNHRVHIHCTSNIAKNTPLMMDGGIQYSVRAFDAMEEQLGPAHSTGINDETPGSITIDSERVKRLLPPRFHDEHDLEFVVDSDSQVCVKINIVAGSVICMHCNIANLTKMANVTLGINLAVHN